MRLVDFNRTHGFNAYLGSFVPQRLPMRRGVRAFGESTDADKLSQQQAATTNIPALSPDPNGSWYYRVPGGAKIYVDFVQDQSGQWFWKTDKASVYIPPSDYARYGLQTVAKAPALTPAAASFQPQSIQDKFIAAGYLPTPNTAVYPDLAPKTVSAPSLNTQAAQFTIQPLATSGPPQPRVVYDNKPTPLSLMYPPDQYDAFYANQPVQFMDGRPYVIGPEGRPNFLNENAGIEYRLKASPMLDSRATTILLDVSPMPLANPGRAAITIPSTVNVPARPAEPIRPAPPVPVPFAPEPALILPDTAMPLPVLLAPVQLPDVDRSLSVFESKVAGILTNQTPTPANGPVLRDGSAVPVAGTVLNRPINERSGEIINTATTVTAPPVPTSPLAPLPSNMPQQPPINVYVNIPDPVRTLTTTSSMSKPAEEKTLQATVTPVTQQKDNGLLLLGGVALLFLLLRGK